MTTKTASKTSAASKKTAAFAELYAKAHEAGMNAANRMTPTPMIVGTAKSLFSREFDRSKPTYYVEGGVCGFAYIQMKPANCGFAKYLLDRRAARQDFYNGGICISVQEFGQSMQRKTAYAEAFAAVISEAGVCKKVYAYDRMD